MPAETPEFLLGEYRRSLDERFRVSLPMELADALTADGADLILTKERPGALSLWSATRWQERLDRGVQLVESKMNAGRLDGRLDDVQTLGRLLSTRHRTVQIAGRGRLLVPEGFRDFLGLEPGDEAVVVGAAVCVEIWRPSAWLAFLEHQMPTFGTLFDSLSS